MAQLPQELIVEILLWLPVKSLKRFRCLSKSLCEVIDSLDFINLHLNTSSQNFNLRKLIFPDRWRKKFNVCDVNFDFEEDILPVVQPISTFWRDGEVCGNCNGLLLLCQSRRKYPFRFALWNPSTRQFRDLPDCPCEIPGNVDFQTMIGSGLGYDDSRDEYKAILIVYMKKGGIEVEVQFWIYSLKSNIWRRALNFPYSVFHQRIGYFTDCSLHWICTSRNVNQSVDWRGEIVAFDVRKETFSLVPQPVICCSINPVAPDSLKLHVLEGCLCVSYFYNSKLARVDLFIRKKDVADQFSWTNLFSITEPLSLDIDDLYFMTVQREEIRFCLILIVRLIYMILKRKFLGKLK